MNDALVYVGVPIALMVAIGLVGLLIQRSATQQKLQMKLHMERLAAMREQFWAEVDDIVSRHRAVLASKHKNLVYKDEYGELQLDAWTAELDKFIDNFVEPLALKNLVSLSPLAPKNRVSVDLTDVYMRISEAAVAELRKNPGRYTASVEDGDGQGFEDFVKDKLEQLGLQVSKTKSGADQGVDLIVEHQDFRAALQCKNYGQPIGNAAVQEVYSGAAFYSPPPSIPVVVGRSGFTQSARQLAQSVGVLLVDAHDLETLEILLIGEALSRQRSAR